MPIVMNLRSIQWIPFEEYYHYNNPVCVIVCLCMCVCVTDQFDISYSSFAIYPSLCFTEAQTYLINIDECFH